MHSLQLTNLSKGIMAPGKGSPWLTLVLGTELNPVSMQ